MDTVKIETIVRTIILFVALINQGLSLAGYSLLPITDDQINDAVTLILTIGSSLWAWWKNNSFTKNAIEADKVLDELNSKEG